MRLGLILTLTLILAGCSPARSARTGSRATTFAGGSPNEAPSGKAETSYVTTDWTPNEVEVDCAADRCPLQVGALIFAEAPANGQILTRRCTAFLISADTIVSNGHCDGFAKEKGYFVTQRINGQKEVRAVSGVVFKRFTPHPKGAEIHSGRPDVALFSLDRPIQGLPGLRLASGPQLSFTRLTAFAIMKSSGNRMSIEKHECYLKRHEAEFPFEINEAPDMIRAYGCRLLPGTSGSPMFADGSDEVQAVHASGLDPINRAKNRALLPYEKHWSSLSTNVRCLDLPGSRPLTCVLMDRANISRRFQEAQRAEFENLNSRKLNGVDPYVQFRAYRYQLSPARDLRFEIMHVPKCRLAPESLRSVPIVIEQVVVEMDEWGFPKTRSLSLETVNASVRSVSANIHEMEIAWPAPPMPHANPESDLRKQWGGRFGIDLPVCPR